MKGKKIFFSEGAYVVGLIILAVGTALMEKANFGMSMVVAPAYIIYLKASETISWFTFGMAEYCLQAFLLLLLAIILRKFKPMYLFSFCTAVLYGCILDVAMWLVSPMNAEEMVMRAILFICGMICCSLGVALLFHSYIAPEAYELLVKEIALGSDREIAVVKTAYDCTSCGIAILLSFWFFGFGSFEGVNWGTVVCALVNGYLIGKFSAVMERHLEFKDMLSYRKIFN